MKEEHARAKTGLVSRGRQLYITSIVPRSRSWSLGR